MRKTNKNHINTEVMLGELVADFRVSNCCDVHVPTALNHVGFRCRFGEVCAQNCTNSNMIAIKQYNGLDDHTEMLREWNSRLKELEDRRGSKVS